MNRNHYIQSKKKAESESQTQFGSSRPFESSTKFPTPIQPISGKSRLVVPAYPTTVQTFDDTPIQPIFGIGKAFRRKYGKTFKQYLGLESDRDVMERDAKKNPATLLGEYQARYNNLEGRKKGGEDVTELGRKLANESSATGGSIIEGTPEQAKEKYDEYEKQLAKDTPAPPKELYESIGLTKQKGMKMKAIDIHKYMDKKRKLYQKPKTQKSAMYVYKGKEYAPVDEGGSYWRQASFYLENPFNKRYYDAYLQGVKAFAKILVPEGTKRGYGSISGGAMMNLIAD